MTLTQNWVGYLDRSYEQIKRSCLAQLGVIAPEISDHSESNPLIIFLSMFSGIAEMLNLYVDSAAREAYIGTARRYSSAVKLSRLIDYNVRAMNPASVNLLWSLVDGDGNPAFMPIGTLLNIPAGTLVSSINGSLPFVLNQTIQLLGGNYNVYGSASQFIQVSGDILGSTDGSINQKIDLPDNYVDASLEITINGVLWSEYRSFGIMFSDTKGFLVSIDENGQAYFEFGDNVNGVIPTSGFTIFANYKICDGISGNIPPNQISVLGSTVVGVPTGLTLKVTNPDYASGGTDFESLQDIQNRAPRSIRTLERAVTYQDYLDLCYLVLGVGAAEVSYCCGKFVDIYIAPNTKGSATEALLQAVLDYINCRKMITTQIHVLAAGISKIWIKATIYGKPYATESQVYDQVVNQLDLKYGYSTLKINPKISIPAIIANLEILSNVESVEINQVKIEPFARPIDGTTNPLNVVFIELPTSTIPYVYTIQWNQGMGKFIVYKGSFAKGNFLPDDIYTDDQISFQLAVGTYTNGDRWQFTVFPSYPEIFPVASIQITDFSAAIVDVGPLVDPDTPRTIFSNLTIVTQSSSTGCLPPC